ncbi:unnamed protein product [Leuciscus chuanchicus]
MVKRGSGLKGKYQELLRVRSEVGLFLLALQMVLVICLHRLTQARWELRVLDESLADSGSELALYPEDLVKLDQAPRHRDSFRWKPVSQRWFRRSMESLLTQHGRVTMGFFHREITFTNMNPKTRNDFLQYSHQLTLDLNTVHKRLSLSERNRVITVIDTEQPYPDHPDRFDHYPQVLCRESVCGRCYWEIEWSGDDVFISVSYK